MPPPPTYYRALDRLPRTPAPAALLHMHYGGTAAIDAVATLLRLRVHPPDRPFHLLDVGSGAGAPARYLANTFPNVHIDCIECDASRHATASALTAREPAHVRRRVRHTCYDYYETPPHVNTTHVPRCALYDDTAALAVEPRVRDAPRCTATAAHRWAHRGRRFQPRGRHVGERAPLHVRRTVRAVWTVRQGDRRAHS